MIGALTQRQADPTAFPPQGRGPSLAPEEPSTGTPEKQPRCAPAADPPGQALLRALLGLALSAAVTLLLTAFLLLPSASPGTSSAPPELPDPGTGTLTTTTTSLEGEPRQRLSPNPTPAPPRLPSSAPPLPPLEARGAPRPSWPRIVAPSAGRQPPAGGAKRSRPLGSAPPQRTKPSAAGEPRSTLGAGPGSRPRAWASPLRFQGTRQARSPRVAGSTGARPPPASPSSRQPPANHRASLSLETPASRPDHRQFSRSLAKPKAPERPIYTPKLQQKGEPYPPKAPMRRKRAPTLAPSGRALHKSRVVIPASPSRATRRDKAAQARTSELRSERKSMWRRRARSACAQRLLQDWHKKAASGAALSLADAAFRRLEGSFGDRNNLRGVSQDTRVLTSHWLVSTYPCPRVESFGPWGHGSTRVCVAHRGFSEPPVVVTVGGTGSTHFEKEVYEKLHAQVHVFTAYASKAAQQQLEASTFLKFHNVGIAGMVHVRRLRRSRLRSIKWASILEVGQKVGARYMDILKLDCEGCELDVIRDLGTLSRESPLFGQIIVELHHLKKASKTVSLLQLLESKGYRMFYSQPNGFCLQCYHVAYIHDSLLQPEAQEPLGSLIDSLNKCH